MPTDDSINLDKPLTEEDIRKMEKEAERIERAARKAEREAKQIQDAANTLKEYEEAQGRSPLAAFGGGSDKSTGSGFGGLGGKEAGSGTISKGRRVGQSTEKAPVSFERIQEMIAEFEEHKEEFKNVMDEAKKHRQELEKKIGEIEGGIQRGFSEFTSFGRNPIQFGRGKAMGLLKGAGLYGAIATFIIEMGEQIYNQIRDEVVSFFQPGGRFDVRKIVLDVAGEYNHMDYLIKIKAGRIFYTGDAGQDLRQGAVRDEGNTRELRDGHLRYINFAHNE